MRKMRNMIQSYYGDEVAGEDLKQILFYVAAVIVVVAIVWFAWNLISSWAEKGNDASDNANSSTHARDPFGNGPFGG